MKNKKSGNIYLRPLEKKDINKRCLSWFTDKKVTKFLESRNITAKESKSYLEVGINTGRYYLLAICYSITDLHIGNIKIGPIRREDGVSDLVTVLGDKNYWGRGIATSAIREAVKIGFIDGGIRKFIASIDSLNIASLNAYLSGGFQIESKIKNYFFHKNQGNICFSDKIFVSCENEEYDMELLKNWKINE